MRLLGLLGCRQLAALVRHGQGRWWPSSSGWASTAEMATSLASVVTTERRPELKVRRTSPHPSDGCTASGCQSLPVGRGRSARGRADHTAVSMGRQCQRSRRQSGGICCTAPRSGAARRAMTEEAQLRTAEAALGGLGVELLLPQDGEARTSRTSRRGCSRKGLKHKRPPI